MKVDASGADAEPHTNTNETKHRSRAIGAETEATIIRVASEEFALHGYEAVSMRSIAARVEITPPSIYLYFRDKRSLYVACCLHSVSALCAQMIGHMRSRRSPARRLEVFLTHLTDALLHDPGPARLFLRTLMERDDDILARLERDLVHELFVLIRDAIGELHGNAKAAESAASMLALTLGLLQFSPFIESAGYSLSFNRNPKALARHVMATILKDA